MHTGHNGHEVSIRYFHGGKAGILGRPTLGLFGPTEWWLYGPWGPKTATVASNETRGQFAPIEDLSVDHVFQAVLRLHDQYVAGAAPTPTKP